jgi:hypothetical protein
MNSSTPIRLAFSYRIPSVILPFPQPNTAGQSTSSQSIRPENDLSADTTLAQVRVPKHRGDALAVIHTGRRSPGVERLSAAMNSSTLICRALSYRTFCILARLRHDPIHQRD